VLRIEGNGTVLRLPSIPPASDTPAMRRIAPRNFSAIFMIFSNWKWIKPLYRRFGTSLAAHDIHEIFMFLHQRIHSNTVILSEGGSFARE
jgi:hypothetical protein